MMTHHVFAFLVLISSSVSFAQIEAQWSESEHLELGEKGAQKACGELGISADDCPIKNIHRADNNLTFRYGELVAAADFYNTPLQMDNDHARGIAQVIRCTHAAVNNLIDLIPISNDSANCNLSALLSIPGYLEVVTKNYSHFGWNNMVAYVTNHQLALKKARESFLKKSENPRQSRRLLEQALIYNGFADHYLTDAFASGHIRVPRIQTKKWAFKNLTGSLISYRGDLLSLIMHDQESRNLRSGNEEGLRVKNSLGDLWQTHGDGDLHTNTNESDLGYILPILATKQSFKEVLDAWKNGKIADGIFLASEYVPFHNDVSMVIKFSPEYQHMKKREMIRLIYSSVPFLEGFWFQKSDLEKMLNVLPDIFHQFQTDVSQEIQNQPELQKHLPQPYLDAYKNVD